MNHESTAFHLRPAQKSDADAIQRLIKSAGINPTGLDWRRFWLAVNAQDEMLGCVQLKPHRDGSMELASLAVTPARRGAGIGRALIEHMLARRPDTLYLTCRAGLGSYYAQFGFQPVAEEEMPPYFRRVYRLFKLLKLLPGIEDDLLVMRL
ncbi:MAG TPA: GNAT family N-acetyltransferase [Anaerolineales bacterium]|nr:GNAT family N-acetyltransferase [Anaerolineales bacterium]